MEIALSIYWYLKAHAFQKKRIVMIIYSVIDIIILKKVKKIIIVCYNVKLFNQNRIAEFLISHFLHDFL